MNAVRLIAFLRLDAAANLLAGVAVIVLADRLVGALGLGSSWPLWLLGVVLAGYGVENALISRRPTRGGLTGLATVDVAFAAVVVGLVAIDPTGMETAARWILAGVAAASLAVGGLKLSGRELPESAPARARGTGDDRLTNA